MCQDRLVAMALTAAIFAVAAPVAAQPASESAATSASAPPSGNQAFGPGDQVTYLSAPRFTGRDLGGYQGELLGANSGGWHVFSSTGAGIFVADASLPAGASLQSIWCQIYDPDPSTDVSIGYEKKSFNTSTNFNTLTYQASAQSTGNPGYTTIGIIVPTAHSIIRYEAGADHHLYFVTVTLRNTHMFRGCALIWRRTVSPAPASATFADIPVGDPLHRFVEALVASGITAGCGGGNYCPNAPITRGQMAVFLAASLGLHWPW